MAKVFTKYFLALCIFLLNGYVQVSAHTLNSHPSIKNITNPLQTHSGIEQSVRTFKFKHSLPGTENESGIIGDAEWEEKDESNSFKKYLDVCSYCTTLFYAHLPVYVQTLKTIFLKSGHSSSGGQLCIIFCTFRI